MKAQLVFLLFVTLNSLIFSKFALGTTCTDDVSKQLLSIQFSKDQQFGVTVEAVKRPFPAAFTWDFSSIAKPKYLNDQVSNCCKSGAWNSFISASGKYTFVQSATEVIVFETQSGKRLGFGSFIKNIALSDSQVRVAPDEKTFVLLQAIRDWNSLDQKKSIEVYQINPFKKLATFSSIDFYYGISYDASSTALYTVKFADNMYKFFKLDLLTGKSLSEQPLPANDLYKTISLTPDGKKIVIGVKGGSGDVVPKRFIIFDAKTFSIIGTVPEGGKIQDGNLGSAFFPFESFSPDSGALSLLNGWVYDLNTGKTVFGRYVNGRDVGVGSGFSIDGTKYTVAYKNRSVSIFNTKTAPWKLISDSCLDLPNHDP